jgi:uncharacterized RDD family membrane protein YckC
VSKEAAASTPDDRPVVLRRVIARLLDDTLLAAISVVLVLAMARTFGDHTAGVFYPDDGGSTTSYEPYVDGSASPLAIVTGGLLASGLFAGYSWISSLREGVSLGRLVTGLKVLGADGGSAPARLLFGREILRLALICVALAIIAPVGSPIGNAMSAVAEGGYSTELSQLSAVLGSVLPAAVVFALLVGFTLVDPKQRAPHDRLAKTIVVRR